MYHSWYFNIGYIPTRMFRVYITRKSGYPWRNSEWCVHLIPGVRVTGCVHRDEYHVQADWLLWEVGFNTLVKRAWWFGR
jgi:hypothetical protein